MGLGNILVLSQVTAFLVSFITGLFICAPLAVNQRSFNGHCLLYASGQWQNTTTPDKQFLNVEWGPSSACGFILFMGIVTVLLSLFYIVLESIYLFKNTDSSWLEAFVTTIVCMIVALMHFAAALMLSVGFNHWCDLVTQPGSGIESCEIADYIQIPTESGNIDTSEFYAQMKMGEFGSWTCLVCWCFLSVTSVVKVVKFQQHESFMSSVGRERQRLLQKVGHRTDYTV